MNKEQLRKIKRFKKEMEEREIEEEEKEIIDDYIDKIFLKKYGNLNYLLIYATFFLFILSAFLTIGEVINDLTGSILIIFFIFAFLSSFMVVPELLKDKVRKEEGFE